MPFLSSLIERFTRPSLAVAPVAAPPVQLSLDEQMSRLMATVASSRDSSATTSRCHATAEDQLDAATYALKELMKDLSAVMTVPALRSGAALYHLPAAAPVAIAPQRRRASAA